jgi:hypothetical protein
MQYERTGVRAGDAISAILGLAHASLRETQIYSLISNSHYAPFVFREFFADVFRNQRFVFNLPRSEAA